MNFRFPQALKLSLSTLLVGGVYVLQNAETYATKIIDTALPGAEDAAHWLTIAAEYTGLAEWNTAQRTWLEKWIALGTDETEEDENLDLEDELSPEEVEPPVTPPEEPEPEPPQPEPAEPPMEAPVQEATFASDDETDPLPATGYDGPEPPAPLLDSEPSPIATAEPLPWSPSLPHAEPAMEDVIEPTPPPTAPLEDVSEPDSAPTPPPGTEQPVADATNTDATPVPPVEITKQAPLVRCKVVLMGDSLMEDLGPRTHRLLNHRKGLQFILSAKYSTGLCRPDYFDWPAHMREVIAEHKPDFLIVFIGANDGQPIKHGNTFVPTGSNQWSEVYGQKMQEIVDIANDQGTKVIWIGLPVMGKHKSLLAETTRVQKEHCTRMGIPYVDSNATFADADGNFISFRKDANGKIVRLRRQDKIHLSPEGNHALIDILLPVIEKNLAEFSATHPERCLNDEEAKKTTLSPLIVTIKYRPSARKESTRKKKRKKND